MSPEIINSSEVSVAQAHQSPLFLRLGLLAMYLPNRYPRYRSVEIENVDNLDLLASTGPMVITPNHQTDYDFPLVLPLLAKHADLRIAGQSTHLKLWPQPETFIGAQLGRKYFLPVSTTWSSKQGKHNLFAPSDAGPAVKALGEGKSVVVATHSPSSLTNGRIRTGHLAALIALRAKTPIMPVRVATIEARHGRFDARIVIGKPYNLEPVSKIEDFVSLIDKRHKHNAKPEAYQPLTPAEIDVIKTISRLLRNASQQVFEAAESLK